jgi:alkylation response protein AidB-like acyl-CoA dehydrogenase
MPITLYGSRRKKLKYVPKLASGEWFGAYCLTWSQELDLMLIQEKQKQFYLKMENTILSLVKNVISNAGFCSLFIVLLELVR